MWIKRTSAWSSIKNMWIKTSAGWSPVRSGYIRQNTSSTGWKRFWFKANLPNQITAPKIHTTNNSGTGTIYDGPDATSPQILNANLYGKDGTYSNYTSIPERRFTYGDTIDSNNRTTVVTSDLFTSSVSGTTRLTVDEKYLFYEMDVKNGTDPLNQITSVSTNPVKMIKDSPYSRSFLITGSNEIYGILELNFSLDYYYYNRPELSTSVVKWYVSDTFGDTSGTPVQTTTLSSALVSTSSTEYVGYDSLYVYSSYLGKYITAVLYGENSWTRHYGYATATYSMDYDYAGGGNPVTGPLSFSNVSVKDYAGNNGLDNRDRWTTGTTVSQNGQLSGYDSSTVLRIRYRVINNDTGLYWNPYTDTQTTASAAWSTWTTDGSGDGSISSYSVSGSTLTFLDYFTLNESVFNGGGSGPTWSMQVEISAIKTGGTRVYYTNPFTTYPISKRIDSTVSVSPSTVSPNTSVTISGTFAGYPATPSTNAYPRQYKVDYGDGSADSGWLPVGEWANGTLNPTYSLTKSYSTGGTYTITTKTIPLGTNATTTVTVANLPTNTVAPTLTTDTGNFSAGSTITLNAGTWTGTNSYKYEILYGGSSPIADNSTSTKTLVNTNQYVITNSDATAGSYYFRGRVTGYSGFSQTGDSAIALTETSARSTIIPSTTVSVGTATSSGFTISGSASPASYTAITEIQIWNSSLTSQIATITTGLPTINASTGAWSYVWTGGSASTTYYARVKIRSTDSDQTTITTGFAGPIATSAALTTPTSLSATTNDSAKIRLTWSGGSGDEYMLYYLGSANSWPAQSYTGADFTSTSSPYDWTTMSRGIDYYFWVRARNGTSPNFTYSSNWYPAQTTGIKGRAPYYAPPNPTITNSAQTSTSLSWYWDQPTPSSTQDQPSSWDYAISTSTVTPTSWTNLATRPTSSSPLVTSSLSASTTYYLHVRAKNEDASTTTYQSGTTSAATTLYTVTFNTNGASGSPSVSSVTQSTQGGSVTLATIGTMSSTGNIFGGWRTGTSSGTVYAFGASFTPTSNITLYAYFGATPTCAAPAWGASNFTRSNANSEIIWYTDFPTPSGAYSSIASMQFQISTTQSTTGILVGGTPIATRSYPGSGSYPYSGGGTIWAFKCGRDRSSVGQVSDIAFNTAARYARARVRMVGIDGATYLGDWTGWY